MLNECVMKACPKNVIARYAAQLIHDPISDRYSES